MGKPWLTRPSWARPRPEDPAVATAIGALTVFSSGWVWGSRTEPQLLSWSLCGPFVFDQQAAEDGLALDPLLGEVGHGVAWPGRAELAAAVGRRLL
jgi:hypothetical protein